MATVSINKELLKSISKLSTEQALDIMQKIGLEIESSNHESLTVDVTPNRPDLLSTITIAQALKTFHNGEQAGITIHNSNYRVLVDSSVNLVRPFTACCVVKNISLDENKLLDLIQLQEKLHSTICRNRNKAAIGIYPLEHIRFPITYKALKPNNIKFKPLDFDREMTASEILKNHPKGIEFAHLLKGKKLYPVFVDANNNILSMPPIINSETTGRVTPSTKQVFIEVSGFDIEFLNKVLLIIANAFIIIGGDVFKIKMGYKHGKTIPTRKTVSTPFIKHKKFRINKQLLLSINKLTGLKLSQKDLHKLLKRMGYVIRKQFIYAQPYRFDILHWVDIAEDALISYGYENLKPEPLLTPSIGGETALSMLKEKLIELFVSMGFVGVKTFHLTNPNILLKAGITEQPIKIENPATTEYSVLRNSLQPLLLEVLSKNKTSKYPQAIFDIGVVFSHNQEHTKKHIEKHLSQKHSHLSQKHSQSTIGETIVGETSITETPVLAFAITHSKAGYTESKQVINELSRFLGVPIRFEPTINNAVIKIKNSNLGILKTGVLAQGRSSNLFLDNKLLGFIGEVHPKVLEAFNLEKPVACGELRLDVLLQHINTY